jgi:hypothetical protein
MIKPLLLLLIITTTSFFSCEKGDVSNAVKDVKIIGEWRYVGTFDHRANYACYICPGFDYEKTIYRINLSEDKSIKTQINFMRGEGNYVLKEKEITQQFAVYDLALNDYRELNKPVETIEDGVFRKAFLASYSLAVSREKEYDHIQLQFNDNEFLLLVKKR